MNKIRITSYEGQNRKLPNVRQSFQLVYYRNAEGQHWRGKITHPLSQEKYVFSGDDSTGLNTFINQFLSDPTELPGISDGQVKIKIEGSNFALSIRDPLGIRCQLAHTLIVESCQLELSAKSLLTGQSVVLEKRRLTDATDVLFWLSPDQLSAGLYRFYVQLKRMPIESSKRNIAEGSRLLLLL